MLNINTKDCGLEFGKYIRDRRERKNMYQREVARKVGISQVHLSNIERGEREISLVLAIKLCDAVGADMRDFMSRYL